MISTFRKTSILPFLQGLVVVTVFIITSRMTCASLVESFNPQSSFPSSYVSHFPVPSGFLGTVNTRAASFYSKTVIGTSPKNGKKKDYHIVHIDSDLCSVNPKDTIRLPEDSFDIAIMLHDGGCDPSIKSRNIMEWYQKDNSRIKAALMYKPQESMENKDGVETTDQESNVPNEDLLYMIDVKVDKDIPLSFFSITNKAARAMIGLMSTDTTSNTGGETFTKSLHAKLDVQEYFPSTLAIVVGLAALINIVSLIVAVAVMKMIWGQASATNESICSEDCEKGESFP